MVSFASAGLSPLISSWPRMSAGCYNPFQNAPGQFFYALANITRTCPFSCSSDAVLPCPFSGDSHAPPPPARVPHHHYPRAHRCYHAPSPAKTSCSDSCCRPHHDPPSEFAGLAPTASTKGGAAPNTTESPLLPRPRPRPPRPYVSSLSPSDESHFGLGDVINPSPLTVGGTEPEQQQHRQHRQRRRRRRRRGSRTSESSTPTQSNSLSTPTDSDFREGPGSKGEGGGAGKNKGGQGRRKSKRKRNRKGKGKSHAEYGPSPMGPRFMNISPNLLFEIVPYDPWTQYVWLQAHLPTVRPPPAMDYRHVMCS
jgi:hypothetical protein